MHDAIENYALVHYCTLAVIFKHLPPPIPYRDILHNLTYLQEPMGNDILI